VCVQSGIVQGSVFGPLLFVLYTNDVTDIFDNSSVCKLYADDVKLYTVIENPSDYTDMQKNLNSLQQWSDQWQLQISYKKCNTLSIGNNMSQNLKLMLDRNILPHLDSSKD